MFQVKLHFHFGLIWSQIDSIETGDFIPMKFPCRNHGRGGYYHISMELDMYTYWSFRVMLLFQTGRGMFAPPKSIISTFPVHRIQIENFNQKYLIITIWKLLLTIRELWIVEWIASREKGRIKFGIFIRNNQIILGNFVVRAIR